LAADERYILHARDADIGHERAGTEQMPAILLAEEAGADPASRAVMRVHLPLLIVPQRSSASRDIDKHTY
jgi:hypothetical protein